MVSMRTAISIISPLTSTQGDAKPLALKRIEFDITGLRQMYPVNENHPQKRYSLTMAITDRAMYWY